ncbi:MAG: CAP domain-containing protein [Caldilinea sp.]
MKPTRTSTNAAFFGQVGIATGIALIFLLLATAPSAAARLYELSYNGCGGADAPVIDDAYEARVVELVNRERSNNGLAPLKRISALDRAARYHATDMGMDNYFSHDTHDRNGGTLVKVCGAFERMRVWYDWWTAAENIGAGYRTPEDVVLGWMESDGHRRNILNSAFREIGVGYFRGAGDYNVYWVQTFGARSDVYPMVINGDSLTSASPEVDVFIHGDWGEMRLRNDSDAWDEWQPFKSGFAWTLNDSAGERIISAELRSDSKIHSTCSKITLTSIATAAPADAAHQLFLPILIGDDRSQVQPQEPVTCD